MWNCSYRGISKRNHSSNLLPVLVNLQRRVLSLDNIWETLFFAIWCRICWVLNYKFVSKLWPPRRDASVRPSRCWQANVNSAVAYWNIFLWRGRVLYDSNVTMNMSVEIGKTLPGCNVNWTIKLKEVIKSVEKPNRSYCFKSDASNKRLSFFYFVRFALWIMNLESIFRLQKTRLSKEPA